MLIGNRDFDVNRHTYIMGILNLTPDSFSDGRKWNGIDEILFRVDKMVEEGADIIDVGGESTRPGYTKISDAEEIERTAPAIEQISKRFDVPISLDTYKSEVAMAGIKAGADLINDIWGLKYDSRMASAIAKAGVCMCIMHNRDNLEYSNLIDDIKNDLSESIKIARNAGIGDDKIILDPGVGFAKTYEDNLLTIKHLGEFNALGFPVLLGASRKSVIGNTLNLPTDERLEGTLTTTVLAVMNNIAFVRVHDIESNVRAVRMAEAIRDI